jgi:transcriptional regulator with XRE-family HTH domain
VTRKPQYVGPETTAAEENLIIDFQFLLQELMARHKISRAELARRAGITEARLSQLFGSEANPTAKTIARLLHALGEETFIGVRPKKATTVEVPVAQWEWADEVLDRPRKAPSRQQLVAVLKSASFVSNDNVRILEWGVAQQILTLEAA